MNTPQSVFDYYQKKLSCDGHIGASIYEIWEKGGSYLDSVTPSTYCLDYRNTMVGRLMGVIGSDKTRRVLSLGCGNAFVEAELVRRGLDVFAIDINREAVELALAKQVPAAEVDFFDLQLTDGRPYDVIYADGFFGHLYNAVDGCKHVLLKARTLLSPMGKVVISNDGPSDNSTVQAHKSVPDFFYLSTQFLKQEGESCGFVAQELTNYGYTRPLSGPRTRSIVTLSVACTV